MLYDHFKYFITALVSSLFILSLSGCTFSPLGDESGGLTTSKRLVFRDQDRAIELTRDLRVWKLLRAYQRQHPKAVKTMRDVATYLRYGSFSVDEHGIIYCERVDAIKTPVEMNTLVEHLERLYLLQDRSQFPVYRGNR